MNTTCDCGDHHGAVPGDDSGEPDGRHPLLTGTLRAEDRDEDDGRLDPMDRVTCRTHRRWLHDCVASPVHTNSAVGYRWCRRCDHQALVAVDELTGDVTIRCGLCGHSPRSRANVQLVERCRRSLQLARSARFPNVAAA